MNGDQKLLVGFAAALGSGLLIGIERERRKGNGAHRAPTGIRTFTLASLTGAAAGFIAAPLLTFAGGMLIATLGAISHWRSRPRNGTSGRRLCGAARSGPTARSRPFRPGFRIRVEYRHYCRAWKSRSQ